MTTPTTPVLWTAIVAAPPPVRAAFATLDRPARRLVEAMVFDGQSCARIAEATGDPVACVRRRAGAALLALHAALTERDADRGGAVAAMLVLRALDALDPDEAELVDVMLDHQPALQRAYAGYRELVGALCTMVPRIAPPPCALARLCQEIGDDPAAN
jgi:hypothetical protein